MTMTNQDPQALLASVAEYADLKVAPEALPVLGQLLMGLVQGLRAMPNNPVDGVEPAIVFKVPEVAISNPLAPVDSASTPAETGGEIPYLSLSQAANLIRTKALSPVELTQAMLDRIEQIDPKIHAFVTVLQEEALAQAKQAENALMSGQNLGALHGVPIALKDLVETKGIRTTASSQVLNDYVPQRQAAVADKLAQAGTILLGKTHTHEFAYGVVTPTTRNPWNTEHIPGGSSGGSAAAMAAGLALGAIGTDTGGSIRIPSALCGTVGIKPTYGRVSRYGVLSLSWTFDHVGPITRSVRDAALMLQAIAGKDRRDPASSDVTVGNYTAHLEGGIRGLRVGVPRAYFYDRLQPEVAATMEKALQTFKELGAEIREIELPGIAETVLLALTSVIAEASSYHQEWLRSKPELYQPDVRPLLEVGELMLASDYLRAQRRRTQILNQTLAAFEQVDVFVTPTEPCIAPRTDQPMIDYPDGQEDVFNSLIRLTGPFNATGLPALSVPCGFSQGLPVGMQIVGRPFDEATVLRAGYTYEQATDWHNQHPTF